MAFVSHSRLATDRVGCFGPSVVMVVVEGSGRQVHFHFHFHPPSALPCLRPFSVRILQKSVVFCRYLYVDPLFSPYCSCAIRPSIVCHAADPRRNLSPPEDSTTPALPAAACDLQPARDLPLRPPLTQLLNRGNTAYHLPRGIPLPLAASTTYLARTPSCAACAITRRRRCARPDSTLAAHCA